MLRVPTSKGSIVSLGGLIFRNRLVSLASVACDGPKPSPMINIRLLICVVVVLLLVLPVYSGIR